MIARRRRGRMAIGVALLSLAALRTTADARLSCTGPFKKSCLRKLFRGFNPSGSCAVDTEMAADFSAVQVTVCWANGVTSTITSNLATRAGGLTVKNSRGKVITTGSVNPTTSGTETTYTRKGSRWILRVESDGSLAVTCPSGKVEAYTASELARGRPGCTGTSAACTPGSCP